MRVLACHEGIRQVCRIGAGFDVAFCPMLCSEEKGLLFLTFTNIIGDKEVHR